MRESLPTSNPETPGIAERLHTWGAEGKFIMAKFAIMIISTVLCGVLPARASEQVINQWCPVLTDIKADPQITTIYQGKTVALCCDHCLTKFKADPERYIDQLEQFTHTASQSSATTTATEKTGHAEKQGHDHQGDVGETGKKQILLLGRLHPVIAHFPMAGIPLAFLGFIVWLLTRQQVFIKADVPALLAATVAAVVAVISGQIRHDAMRFSGALDQILEQHQFAGIMLMIFCLSLTALRVWRWNDLRGTWGWIYAGGLFAGSILTGVVGYLGGSLVYGPGHLG